MAHNGSEWQNVNHALEYLSRADKLPHRVEGEGVLLELLPANCRRVLDLGTGNGRLLSLVLLKYPEAEGVALDFSMPMLAEAKANFKDKPRVTIVRHDFSEPLPDLGCFDAVVSSLAIHHLEDPRKKQLYSEIHRILNAGGVFCNLEHVSSPTPTLHSRFIAKIGQTPQTEDPSNRLQNVETQLGWLREIGYVDVDCSWKWLEVALLSGYRA
ncbi:MAG: class I SAM-dependent methyltransferase [Candidatus Bathyarchaeota archaeon]|nr:class I SAM-dependent methyltransferase [Candidatus Bathyarchaeota archaeon]